MNRSPKGKIGEKHPNSHVEAPDYGDLAEDAAGADGERYVLESKDTDDSFAYQMSPELIQWFEDAQIPIEYSSQFLLAGVNSLEAVKKLTDEQLQRMGVEIVHRNKILQWVEQQRIVSHFSSSFILMSDLAFDRTVGEGQFGTVYKGYWRGTTTVAIKKLHKELVEDRTMVKEFIREGELMVKIPPHPNIVTCFGTCMSNEGEPMIVNQFVASGNLLSFIRQNKLEQDHLVKIAKGIAAGMIHLASSSVIHRDLSLRNILLDIQHRSTKITYLRTLVRYI